MTTTAPARCYGRSRFPVDEPLPPILVLSDLAAILDLGYSRSKELERAGEFARYELVPRIGNRTRYSGRKFQAWLEQTATVSDEAPALPTSSPAPARRRYFGSTRKL